MLTNQAISVLGVAEFDPVAYVILVFFFARNGNIIPVSALIGAHGFLLQNFNIQNSYNKILQSCSVVQADV
jgi:hypothetical protein